PGLEPGSDDDGQSLHAVVSAPGCEGQVGADDAEIAPRGELGFRWRLGESEAAGLDAEPHRLAERTDASFDERGLGDDGSAADDEDVTEDMGAGFEAEFAVDDTDASTHGPGDPDRSAEHDDVAEDLAPGRDVRWCGQADRLLSV